MIKVVTRTIPADWASAFVNDDWTGLEDDDAVDAAEYLEDDAAGMICVGVEDGDEFLGQWDGYTRMCVTAIFHVRTNRS